MITSTLYADLRKHHLPAPLSLREPADFHDPIPISERLIQAIWANQIFDTSHLQTRNGKLLRIIHPGRWNGEGGPDFTDAFIEMDGREIRGDVEIHVHSTGWNDHRHDLNPAYNHVLLDVCLWDYGPTPRLVTHEGHPVPQLVLHPLLQCSMDELAESLDPDRYPFSPNRMLGRPSPLLRLPPADMADYVESAGRFRFEQKCAGITVQISAHGADQAAYQLLARALGYKHNKHAFSELAQTVTHSNLSRLRTTDEKIEILLQHAHQRPLRCSQVRPANHPHRRLAALALLTECHPSPARWFQDMTCDTKILRRVPAIHHPYWSRHYRLDGKCLAKPVAILGPSRWMEIITNVILPFCAATSGGNTDLIMEFYKRLPAASPNRASRQIAHELGLPRPRRTIDQQGLIQMFQDFELLLPDTTLR